MAVEAADAHVVRVGVDANAWVFRGKGGQDLGRPVGRAVVDHEHFALAVEIVECRQRFTHGLLDALLFVERRHGDGQLQVGHRGSGIG